MEFVLSAALQLLIASVSLSPQPLSRLPADLQPLAKALQSKGFKIVIALPPVKQSYGLFQDKNKAIWVSPITFPLGIARQTFLHKAVHAVQNCPYGKLTPVGWKFTLSPLIEREISAILIKSYHSADRVLEREAFYLQGQSDATSLIMTALKQRCK